MSACRQIQEWLGPYLDGEAPPQTRAAVEAHVAVCATCMAELAALSALADDLGAAERVDVPPQLWTAIDRRLATSAPGATASATGTPRTRAPHKLLLRLRPLLAAAAVLVAAVGVWLFVTRGGGIESPAEAATVNFGALLDGVQLNPVAAFDRFVTKYDGQPIRAAEAHACAPALRFELPDTLPGGFRCEAAFAIRFGENPGIAARYTRDGEFLGVIFHPPVLKEHYGTHCDRDCVMGMHRGHAVEVGEWRLVHVTGATTCHCVLSRLDPNTALPPVLATVAP